MKDVLDQTNQPIDVNKWLHSAIIFDMTFHMHTGNQIRMSGLDTFHIQFSISPNDYFQDQWTLIQLMLKYKSTINNAIIKSKTKNNNTSKWTVLTKLNQISNLWKTFFIFDYLTIITAKFSNDNNKVKSLVQSINQLSKGCI